MTLKFVIERSSWLARVSHLKSTPVNGKPYSPFAIRCSDAAIPPPAAHDDDCDSRDDPRNDMITKLQLLLPQTPLLRPMRLPKRPRDNERKHQRRLGVHLDTLAIHLDLAPRNGLVWPRSRIGSIEFLPGIDVDGIIGSVPLSLDQRYATPRR